MTIDEKLTELRRDLSLMVAFFNRDGSYNVASEAQAALQCVAGLSDIASDFGVDEIDWPVTDEKGQ